MPEPQAAPRRAVAKIPAPLRLAVGLGVSGVLLIVAIWVVAAILVAQDRADELGAVESSTNHLAHAFAEHVESEIALADEITRFVEVLDRQGELTPRMIELAHQRLGVAQFTGLAVFDAQGRPRPGSSPGWPRSAARHDFIGVDASQADAPTSLAQVGPPLHFPGTGRWVVPVSRVLQTPEGALQATVVVAIAPEHFTDFFAGFDLGAGSTVIVAGRDGVARARLLGPAPAADHAAARRASATPHEILRDDPLLRAMASGGRGHYRTAGGQDGVRRMVSYRSLPSYDLVVAVALAEEVALARFARRERVVLSVALGATLALLGVFALLTTAAVRRAQAATELRASRAELARSNARFERAELAAQGAVWEYEEATGIFYISPAFAQQLGLPPAYGPYEAVRERLHPDDQPRMAAAVRALYRGAARLYLECRLARPAGGWRWVSWVGVATRDGDGRVTRLTGSLHDVDERRQAEERAAQLTRLYAALGHFNEAALVATSDQDLYEAACDALHAVGGFELVAVRVADSARAALTPVAARGHALERLGVYQLESARGRCEPTPLAFREGRARYVRDWYADPDLAAGSARARAQGVASVLAVPFQREGQVHGVLSVAAREPDFFAAELSGLIEKVALVLSGALDRRAAVERLAYSEKRFRRLNELSSDWIWERDANLRLTYLSPSYFEITGAQPEQVLGTAPEELDHLAREEGSQRQAYLAALAAQRPFRDYEYARIDADGVVRWRAMSGNPVFDAAGVFRGYQGTGKDISERKRHEEELHYRATRDLLTGLHNRESLADRLGRALGAAQAAGMQLAVGVIDVDQFAVVNDALGPQVGDALIKALGERIVASLGADDTVARSAGDAFTAVLVNRAEDDPGRRPLEALLGVLAAPIIAAGHELQVTVSIGYAVFPRDGATVTALLGAAEKAMRRAKERGRNMVHAYVRTEHGSVTERLELSRALARALEREEFFLVYQPQINLDSGQVTGVEALLRWQHPQLGVVPPNKFVPLAEENGLILPIGDWVLRAACAQNLAWSRAGLPPLVTAVNVSVRQFRGHDLAQRVARVLAETGLPPDRLELELTESIMADGGAAFAQALHALKALGVRIALDDFGTGYSSLNYLERFPIDRIKVDKTFVHRASTGNDVLLGSIIRLGHGLGFEVLAEGVETAEQAELILRHHCRVAQGFYYSPPQPPQDIERLLRGSHGRPGRVLRLV